MKQWMLKATALLAILLVSLPAISQNKSIKGRILDDKGVPLPGTSVTIKGSSKGTTADKDGYFEISAPQNATIIVSNVGFENAEILINENESLEVTLRRSSSTITEVVVTALGIRKEKRNLTYSTQELKSEEILKAKDPFLINTLSGKISGVQITNSSGTPGSSSRILVRGVTSFFGNNEALIVLDGVPIDNSETGSVNSGPGSNRLIDIDPSTVESMNVLKGAAATALYGSAGARGVVIITTKSGSLNKKPLISVSSDLSFDHPIFPEVQDKYAQGENGTFFDGETLKGSSSWGPLMDTLKVSGVPVQKHNQMKEFFRTGVGTNNTVGLSGGGSNSGYYVSYSYYNQQGTVPKTDFVRHSVFTKYNTRVSDKFNLIFQFNYSNSERNSMPEGYILESPVWTIFNGPISYNMKPYLNPDGSQRLYRFSRNNPYWVLDNIYNRSKVNRFLPLITMNFTPTQWLSITERVGADIYTDQIKYFENLGSIANFNGVIVDRTNIARQFNHDLIIEAKKKFNDFDLSLILGNNLFSVYSQTVNTRGVGLSTAGFDNMSNAATQVYSEGHSLARKVGFYSQANLEYKRMLAFSLTGRYDGSSVLADGNHYYPYGSAAVSFIFSELLRGQPAFLNFGKLRLSYATVGNDNVGPYSLNTPYNTATVNGISFPFQGQNGFLLSATLGNSKLKNELSKEFEIGLETKLFNNIGLEVSYFDKNVENGIIPGVLIAPSSGYTGTTVNSAKLETKGIELLITATPVRTTKFNWDVTFTFTRLRNKVLSIYEDIQQLGNGFNQIVVGKPYGVLWGSTYKYNTKGDQLLIDDAGLPIIGEPGITGNITPDWQAGITNNLRYGGFSFSFFFDMKKGGDLQNNVESYGYFYGMPKATEDRGPRVVAGIVQSTGQPNTKVVTGQDYWRRVSGIYEATTQDATYLKLRNVTLSYDLRPGGLLAKTPFKSASIGVTGRNLWLHKPHFTGSDPEASSFGSSNGSQGIYSFSTPTSRSVSFNLRFSF
jgi:TonB-linked SusC/RagA family outer membrane protein